MHAFNVCRPLFRVRACDSFSPHPTPLHAWPDWGLTDVSGIFYVLLPTASLLLFFFRSSLGPHERSGECESAVTSCGTTTAPYRRPTPMWSYYRVLASSSPLLLSVDHQCLADKIRLFCVVLQFNSVRNCQSANAANRTTAAPDCKGSFYEMWIQWRPIAVLPTPWRSSFFFFFSFFLLFSHFSFSVDYYTRELILMAWEMTDSSIYLSLVVTIEHQ